MFKFIKLLCGFLMLMVLFINSVACSNTDDKKDEDDDDEIKETFKSREEVERKLTNYSFRYHYTFSDEDETTSMDILDIRTEDAWLYGYDDILFVANKPAKILYMLNVEEKTGLMIDLGEDNESFSSWSTYLFTWYENIGGAKKLTSEKVVGRTCSVYESKFGTITYKYYIDREHDLCLKYEIYESSSKSNTTFAFTEFKLGGVKTSDVMDMLNGYEIDDYRSIG